MVSIEYIFIFKNFSLFRIAKYFVKDTKSLIWNFEKIEFNDYLIHIYNMYIFQISNLYFILFITTNNQILIFLL